MTKKFLKNTLAFLMLCGFGLFITSCSDSDEDTIVTVETTENFVDQSVFSLQTEGNIGKMGCFEFVFPISIVYPDATEESVDDYETLRTSLRAWFEENADALGLDSDSTRRFNRGIIKDIDSELLPSLAYPLEVMTEDGEVVTVNSKEELKTLKKQCRRSFYGENGRHGHRRGDKCFSLVFPVTIVLPDETTFMAEDRADLKSQLREWKAANPDVDVRPMLQFPVTVQLEDESTVDVASSEELQELKETCSAD